jgi:hypothetical protein
MQQIIEKSNNPFGVLYRDKPGIRPGFFKHSAAANITGTKYFFNQTKTNS